MADLARKEEEEQKLKDEVIQLHAAQDALKIKISGKKKV
jgi:hypothetical protein